jgi:hypothetical protein
MTEKKIPGTYNYSKVVGFKVNKQKPITFLHTINEQVGFEIKKNTIPFNFQRNRNKSNKMHTSYMRKTANI